MTAFNFCVAGGDFDAVGGGNGADARVNWRGTDVLESQERDESDHCNRSHCGIARESEDGIGLSPIVGIGVAEDSIQQSRLEKIRSGFPRYLEGG